MTKREVITRILEEGKRVFENGGSFTINGLLVANFHGISELSFDYEGDPRIVRRLYVFNDGHTTLCAGVDAIERIYVSDNWVMRPGIGNAVFGRINGEFFSGDVSGNIIHYSRNEVN